MNNNDKKDDNSLASVIVLSVVIFIAGLIISIYYLNLWGVIIASVFSIIFLIIGIAVIFDIKDDRLRREKREQNLLERKTKYQEWIKKNKNWLEKYPTFEMSISSWDTQQWQWIDDNKTKIISLEKLKNILSHLPLYSCKKCGHTTYRIWNAYLNFEFKCVVCKKTITKSLENRNEIVELLNTSVVLLDSIYTDTNRYIPLISYSIRNYFQEKYDFNSLKKDFPFYRAITFEVRNIEENDLAKYDAAIDVRSRKIPQSVKDNVWRRDKGRCVECGSNKDLEFDHIIPFSKGGANTYRNLQLLCESCNRKKSANI